MGLVKMVPLVHPTTALLACLEVISGTSKDVSLLWTPSYGHYISPVQRQSLTTSRLAAG